MAELGVRFVRVAAGTTTASVAGAAPIGGQRNVGVGVVRDQHDSHGPVGHNGNARAHGIRQRRIGLGIKSVREFAERSGVSREAVTAAEHGTASGGTYDRLEAWLDRAERENVARNTGGDQVEFRLSGSFGVDVVVRGPVTDMAELESTVTRLIREMRSGRPLDQM